MPAEAGLPASAWHVCVSVIVSVPLVLIPWAARTQWGQQEQLTDIMPNGSNKLQFFYYGYVVLVCRYHVAICECCVMRCVMLLMLSSLLLYCSIRNLTI
jgi:hypothetical protein